MRLIQIGYKNAVNADRIIAVISPDSAPIKRIITDARDRGMLIDATYGRKTKSVIVMDSDHVVLSAVQPEALTSRADSCDDTDKETERD